jgi:putative spermidine/putrescine transport system permease protein
VNRIASIRGRERKTALLQLLPLLLPFLLIFLWGLGYTVAGAFETGGPAGQAAPLFSHYRRALSDPLLRASVLHTLFVALLSAILAVALGTLMALALWRLPRSFLPAATLYKLPIILPHLTAAFIVMVLLSRTGILAAVLHHLSTVFSGGTVTGAYVFPELLYGGSSVGLVAAYVWKEAPFAALMILAVLGRLDYDVVHTGRMLGGGPVFLFRKIIYPHIAPALDTTFIILFLYSLGAFDIPYLIGGSSPRMLSITVYNLYFRRDLAVRPQALALLSLLFLFSLLFVVLFFRVSSRMRNGRTG